MSSQSDQIQRLHYFDNQFLKAEDFTIEQEYHLEMRRRHNRGLHTKGVAEGLQIIKTSEKQITVKAGFAIDEDGNEIILLKDLLISLADTTKYKNDSTIYVFAQYEEKREKPQPETSTNENQSTRFFENAVISAETKEPDIKNKQIVRIGRLKFDTNGNVPDQQVDVPDKDQFLNKDFREEAAAKIPEFSVSIQQLKNTLVAEGTTNIQAGGEFPVRTPGISVTSPQPSKSVFLLVYAHSTTDGAIFNWRQQYKTEKLSTDSELMIRQYVLFQNELTDKPINLQYKIYALEG
ncbi:MAG: hypothetical protein KME50_01175 [Nostoc desertorum CM1-VF14]|jgi:hypothetical protein|nr:hypothetical protein [Nostoc desertorum CM1-VF14]